MYATPNVDHKEENIRHGVVEFEGVVEDVHLS